jgi:hypothetical protein
VAGNRKGGPTKVANGFLDLGGASSDLADHALWAENDDFDWLVLEAPGQVGLPTGGRTRCGLAALDAAHVARNGCRRDFLAHFRLPSVDRYPVADYRTEPIGSQLTVHNFLHSSPAFRSFPRPPCGTRIVLPAQRP